MFAYVNMRDERDEEMRINVYHTSVRRDIVMKIKIIPDLMYGFKCIIIYIKSYSTTNQQMKI